MRGRAINVAVSRDQTPLAELDTSELVGEILVEARELVSAHIADVRTELTTRLENVSSTLRVTIIAVGVVVVATTLLALSIVATLVTLGVAWWAALWLVTGVAIIFAVLLLLAARRRVKTVIAIEPPEEPAP